MDCSRKILVVEDDEQQRNLLQQILSKLGYALETVECAEKALHILESENFALIITDFFMPDMDGAELCKQIKKIRPDSVVYALSGYIAAFDFEEFEKFGFDGYLAKPIGLAGLKKAVEGAFYKSIQLGEAII